MLRYKIAAHQKVWSDSEPGRQQHSNPHLASLSPYNILTCILTGIAPNGQFSFGGGVGGHPLKPRVDVREAEERIRKKYYLSFRKAALPYTKPVKRDWDVP